MKIEKDKYYEFEREVSNDYPFKSEKKIITLKGDKIEGIILAYINTIMYNDSGFIHFRDGGAIVNEEYFKNIFKGL